MKTANQLDLFSPKSQREFPPTSPGIENGSKKTLRPYQKDAVSAALECLARGKNPVISLPTGAGKSICLAALCKSLPGRKLIVTHRKELLTQNADELEGFSPDDAGIYSAGLDSRETGNRIIFGGIQSVYRRMDELQAHGRFSYIISDECHAVSPQEAINESTMYAQVFSACPDARRIGLSATPYRLDGGPVWGEGRWFDELAIDISISSLTPEYLAPLRGILTAHDIDLNGVRKAAGEYILSDMSQIACDDSVVDGALDELCILAKNRHHWLVFCIDIAHTELVTRKLIERGISAGSIIGRTESDERGEVLSLFKAGELRTLVNCMVATTGFNIPSVDAVVMMRPSLSRSLVVQMIGRGSRKAAAKEDCVVIDFSGNIECHAPMDGALYDLEKSPDRQKKDEEDERKKKAYAKRRQRNIQHDKEASELDPFGMPSKRKTQRVVRVSYAVEPSRKYAGKNNIVATYLLHGHPKWVKAWICLEYSGGARWHAEEYFKRRGLKCPQTAAEGYEMLNQSPRPVSVVVDRSEKYPKIIMEHYE
jgi:DNA repair protein RadD